ncbi:MAG TPA: twin-arginine translocase TatA/TatE family subunit [Egibacteraceae bacterium]|nr:twin-arginine translocase TatA/TatE family subunit [Egibacteraceae bacterium]
MGGIGPPELLIVLVLFVLLFGAKKLPDLGSSVGKSIKNFKKGLNEGSAEDGQAEQPAAESEVPPATQTSREP